jgi:hypothetical protein
MTVGWPAVRAPRRRRQQLAEVVAAALERVDLASVMCATSAGLRDLLEEMLAL